MRVALYVEGVFFFLFLSRVSSINHSSISFGVRFFGGFVRSENRLRITKTKWKNTNRRNKLKQKLN